jgi:ABC-type sugar transport system ATPase subunit
MMARLKVKAGSCDVSVRSLSGGNQQKIVLARWLLRNSKILLLDEPSRGVDVGARKQIWQSILGFADSGGAALVISSELEELEACDRVVVMVEGRTVGTLKGRDVTEAKMLEMIYRNEDTHIW